MEKGRFHLPMPTISKNCPSVSNSLTSPSPKHRNFLKKEQTCEERPKFRVPPPTIAGKAIITLRWGENSLKLIRWILLTEESFTLDLAPMI